MIYLEVNGTTECARPDRHFMLNIYKAGRKGGRSPAEWVDQISAICTTFFTDESSYKYLFSFIFVNLSISWTKNKNLCKK